MGPADQYDESSANKKRKNALTHVKRNGLNIKQKKPNIQFHTKHYVGLPCVGLGQMD